MNMEYKLPKWKYTKFPTLEITTSIPRNGCVVDCVFCPQRTLQKKYQGERFLSLENFKRIIDKVPQEIRITFAGFTEPWLNKHCTDMVLYAHEKGHPISVFTTGIGMTIKDFERIRHIKFAPNPNGGFVLHIPDKERRAKHPITPKYIELVRHIQTTHFEDNPIHNYSWMAMGEPHESIFDVISTAYKPDMWSRAGNLLGEAIMKPELLNLKDHFKSIYHGEGDRTCNCEERLYHNILLPNGDVSLCCMDYGLEHILGNLLEQEYNDILPEPYSCFKLCRFCENGISPEDKTIVEEKEMFKMKSERKPIPVIGVPVVANTYWVKRLLMSVDYPVEKFVIINNNGKGEIDDELNELSKIEHQFVKDIRVVNLPGNIGVSGAWNLIIKSTIMASYWIIVNDDVAFTPGFLDEMITASQSDSECGIVHGHSGDFGVGSWDLFLIKDFIISQYGLFDENLYPAYCEDADYIMRITNKGVKRIMSLNSNYYHGNGDKTEYYKEGSQTQKSIPELKEKLDYSNEMNIEYLTEKWGPGWRYCDPQDEPFKNKNHSISETTFDLEFVRKKYMGF